MTVRCWEITVESRCCPKLRIFLFIEKFLNRNPNFKNLYLTHTNSNLSNFVPTNLYQQALQLSWSKFSKKLNRSKLNRRIHHIVTLLTMSHMWVTQKIWFSYVESQLEHATWTNQNLPPCIYISTIQYKIQLYINNSKQIHKLK